MVPPAKSGEDQDDAYVGEQSGPEVLPEEEDIDTHDDTHEHQHVDRNRKVPAHDSCLAVPPHARVQSVGR